jgi:hypothetical protein
MRGAMRVAGWLAAGWSVIGFTLVIVGCTTLRPADATGQDLQRRILAGDLLDSGDRVRLTTADGDAHDVRIDSVNLDTGTITGGRDTISIGDVIRLEQRVHAPAKTWGLVGGLVLLLFGNECEDDPSCDLGYGGLCC